ncbi:PrgI family protein [Frankia sp. AgB1.9]|uniref:PrgI family protein n=1 Tax=unclassified Frankia TaxID=2632575 RepID=UPI00193117BE|nr:MULTISPECIES: PrgI family protein [unclassified Frankia]MBL7491182.1 PrgI family protein [Frankia sp. AgW1.1]MBL7553711.1 PrgI family protein [Frankia sp. AgB1.9]MBL7618005.1 PrgI family protein [Frankia sp. AgB1.8]
MSAVSPGASAGVEVSDRVTIPADLNVEDRILAGLTARQLALLLPTLLLAAGLFWVLSPVVPLPLVAAVCVPVAGVGTALALGRRDGLPASRYVAAAIAFHRTPRLALPAADTADTAPSGGWVPDIAAARRQNATAAPLAFDVHDGGLEAAGVVDLGVDGVAVLAEADGATLTLASPAERASAAVAFARLLNALSGPVQITVRAAPVALAPHLARLRAHAEGLAHPALAAAAEAHADFLEDLAAGRTLLARQILLTAREPVPPRSGAAGWEAAAGRAVRRLEEARLLLAPAGVGVRILDGPAVASLLASLAHPGAPALPDGITATGPITGPSFGEFS